MLENRQWLMKLSKRKKILIKFLNNKKNKIKKKNYWIEEVLKRFSQGYFIFIQSAECSVYRTYNEQSEY